MLKHVHVLASYFDSAVAGPACLKQSFSQMPFIPLPVSKGVNPVADGQCIRILAGIMKQYHLVHAHGYKAALVARLAARNRLPLVVTVHNYPAALASGLYRRVEKSMEPLTSRYIAVSAALGRYLTEDWGLSSRRVTVVANSISLPFCGGLKAHAARWRRASGFTDDQVLVGTLAHLTYQKGIDLFLRAAAILSSRWPRVQFVVGGSGPERKQLQRLARVLGLVSRLKFTGRLEEVFPFLTALNIFVLPSRWEGMPRVAMEAMACGVPVVASAVGGIPEVIGDSGMLVAPEPAALAQGIEELLRDDDRRQVLGSGGPARVLELFNSSRMLQETEQVYRQVLGNVEDNINLVP